MDLLLNILKVLILLFAVYFWNRYIIKNMFKLITRFHQRYNTHNLDRSYIKFYIQNESRLYAFAALLFWLGAVSISYEILMNK